MMYKSKQELHNQPKGGREKMGYIKFFEFYNTDIINSTTSVSKSEPKKKKKGLIINKFPRSFRVTWCVYVPIVEIGPFFILF